MTLVGRGNDQGVFCFHLLSCRSVTKMFPGFVNKKISFPGHMKCWFSIVSAGITVVPTVKSHALIICLRQSPLSAQEIERCNLSPQESTEVQRSCPSWLGSPSGSSQMKERCHKADPLNQRTRCTKAAPAWQKTWRGSASCPSTSKEETEAVGR